MSFKFNSLYLTDGYKVGHKKMLAKGVKRLYGTWIPRSVKHAPKGIKKIVSFGEQMTWKYINDDFNENFFSQPIELAAQFGKDMSMYLGMDYDYSHFEELHKLGYLPIRVKSLPEGIETDPNIPHMTFVNTVDGFGWLTLYLETIVSSLSWKPSTSATIALQYKRNVIEWVNKTDPGRSFLIDWMCHDFSARGLNPWDMISSGLGHATSFKGSDTLPVIPAARYFYNEPFTEVCIGSVNASEHSVSTTKIFTVGEKEMLSDWMKEFPVGILSVVSDTFDLWKLVTEYLPELKEEILARDGKLVIRPDSGDPVDIICGTGGSKFVDVSKEVQEGWLDFSKPETLEDLLLDEVRESTPHGECGVSEYTNMYFDGNKYFEATINNIGWNRYDKQYYYIDMYDEANITVKEINVTPDIKGVIELLWDIFGGTINEQGYKVLDSHIGAIYGDSITLERQIEIYKRLEAKGFAATNIVLGIGSFTYQFNTRDTLGFAAKGSWFETNEGSFDIYKDPVTDDGTKKSIKGLVRVDYDENGEIVLFPQQTIEEEKQGLLQVIFEDGKFYNQTSLTEIRERILKQI